MPITFLKIREKWGRGNPCLSGSVVETKIGSEVGVNKTNGLLDLVVLAQADGGRRRSRFRRRTGRKEDVFSAMLVLVPEGKIEVDLRGKLGYAERLPKIIAGAASECFNRYILVSICRDDDNGNRRRNILDFSHGLDAGHIGQPVFNDRKINLAVSLHPFDRYPAALCCDDLIGAGKVLDISVEKSSVVINDQYMRISSVFHGRQSAISFPPLLDDAPPSKRGPPSLFRVEGWGPSWCYCILFSDDLLFNLNRIASVFLTEITKVILLW